MKKYLLTILVISLLFSGMAALNAADNCCSKGSCCSADAKCCTGCACVKK